MKKIFSSLFIIISFTALSQNKQLTIEDAVLKAQTSLAPKNLSGLKFIKGTNDVSYVDTVNNEVVLQSFSMANGNKKIIFTQHQLKEALQKADIQKETPMQTMNWKNKDILAFAIDSMLYEYNIITKKIFKLGINHIPNDAENIEKTNRPNLYAFTKQNNVFIYNNGKEIEVTNESNKDIVCGTVVHRNEFGIVKGLFWSPNNNKLAFYKMDQTMVTSYPIINWSEKPAANNNIKYPFAGEKSHEVTLGVYDMISGKTVYMQTGEPKEQYLTNIAWSPDEKFMYIAVLNRDQNHMKLNQYDALTGSFIKTLFEEKDEKYVEPQHPMMFVKNNPTQFIWQSMRDGHNHLYLHDVSGKMIRQLTKGAWEVLDYNGFDATSENVFFHANAENPMNKDFYEVNVKSAKITKLTNGNGYHTCRINEEGTAVIDYFSNTTIPRNIFILDLKKQKQSTLLYSANPLQDYNIGQLKLFSIKNNQGTNLYCRMITPPQFDPTKKYPVLVYLYGGSHAQMVLNNWLGGANLWFHYMAQKGFIVFTLDNRGSENRGKNFEQATFRQLGTAEMEDQLVGVNYLKTLPYVDTARMGIHGWSFGGFMTTSLMTRHPGVFKVAVAGGPVIDWSYYEAMYTERYMDTPQQNPEGYNNNNLLNYVQNLKGKLLLIHGTDDNTVVWQHSIMYLKKAVEKGVQLDYFIYPGHEHNVQGEDRAHLMEKISQYFIEHL